MTLPVEIHEGEKWTVRHPSDKHRNIRRFYVSYYTMGHRMAHRAFRDARRALVFLADMKVAHRRPNRYIGYVFRP